MSRQAKEDPRETIRLLQQELADTNREVLALALELEQRVDARTSELRAAQEELQRTNSALLNMTLELENRAAKRTEELEQANQSLRQEVTERKQTQTRLQTQLSRVELLSKITRAIAERQDLISIVQVVIANLETEMPLDFGCMCRYDPVAAALVVNSVGARSEPLAVKLSLVGSMSIPAEQNAVFRCVAGELVYEPDTAQVNSLFAQRFAAGGLAALVLAPLVVEKEIFGILIAARRAARSFSSTDCEFLRQLCEHVGLAAHQAQLYATLQHAYDDLRQTQAVMMEQERLRALGQMASGIAHDINNSIAPAALYTSSLLERETNLSPRAIDYLTTIQRAIEDVGRTVARMRDFYRSRAPQVSLVSVSVNSLIAQVVNLTRARWKDMPEERGIVLRLEMELAPELPDILGDEGDIRDALTNLIFNAVDAMPRGGTLALKTRRVDVQSSSRVYVEVSDTGVGMDAETQRRCLEPFFTTKGERGTGLGLATVYGMIGRHGAEIEIESELGKGTTIRLIFPEAVPATSPTFSPSPHAVPPRRLRILVVDDDPLIIKALRDILVEEGHTVITADGGEAGIKTFMAAKERDELFSVVITDLGMPHVNGTKVAEAVKRISSTTPVILLTGWGQRLMAENETPPHVDRVLSKPPKLRDLRAAFLELAAPSGNKP